LSVSVVAQTPALKVNRVEFKRTLQKLPQLDHFVPLASPAGYLPVPKAFRTEFDRTIQPVIHDEWKRLRRPHPGPIIKANRISFKRKLQTPLELNERPPTIFGFQAGFIPGSRRVEARRVEFKRTRRDLPLLTEYDPTPIGYRAGQWPSHLQLKPFKVDFTRTLQKLAHPEATPATPPVFVSYDAQFRVDAIKRRDIKRRHQAAINAHVYPPTSPLFYTGEWPASARAKPVKEAEFNRTHRRAPFQPQFPPAVPGFREGFWPASVPPPTLIQSFERTLRDLPQHDVWPATPPGFFTGFWTGFLLERPFKVDFTRTLQILPHPAASPQTPPVFIEMPAQWPAKPIKRRETRRKLQPILHPPRKEGFRFDAEIECKWWADCQPVKWEADAATTVWKADWTDTWDTDCD
jgi:hypothetical protein